MLREAVTWQWGMCDEGSVDAVPPTYWDEVDLCGVAFEQPSGYTVDASPEQTCCNKRETGSDESSELPLSIDKGERSHATQPTKVKSGGGFVTACIPQRPSSQQPGSSIMQGPPDEAPSASGSSSSAERPAGQSGDEFFTEGPSSFSARVSGTAQEASGSGTSKTVTGQKRKADVDWKSIEDPSERRKQRRLAKNRATAAVSRERKRLQLASMSAQVRGLEQENAALKYALSLRDSEVSRLRGELASLGRGASRAQAGVATSHPEPAVLLGFPGLHPFQQQLQALTASAAVATGGTGAPLHPSADIGKMGWQPARVAATPSPGRSKLLRPRGGQRPGSQLQRSSSDLGQSQSLYQRASSAPGELVLASTHLSPSKGAKGSGASASQLKASSSTKYEDEESSPPEGRDYLSAALQLHKGSAAGAGKRDDVAMPPSMWPPLLAPGQFNVAPVPPQLPPGGASVLPLSSPPPAVYNMNQAPYQDVSMQHLYMPQGMPGPIPAQMPLHRPVIGQVGASVLGQVSANAFATHTQMPGPAPLARSGESPMLLQQIFDDMWQRQEGVGLPPPGPVPPTMDPGRKARRGSEAGGLDEGDEFWAGPAQSQ